EFRRVLFRSTYDIKYYLPETNNWSITTGVNGMYQHNSSTNGTEFLIPSYNQFDFGPFVMAKKTFGKVDVAGGLRYDIRSFRNSALYSAPNSTTGFDMAVSSSTPGADTVFSDFSKTFAGLSGSAGFTYNVSDAFSLKVNIARGFRAPNISEISSNGVHPGTNFYQLGNANFKPEFSLQEDAGIVYSTKHFSASLSLFNNDIQNYIYNQTIMYSDGTNLIIVTCNQHINFLSTK